MKPPGRQSTSPFLLSRLRFDEGPIVEPSPAAPVFHSRLEDIFKRSRTKTLVDGLGSLLLKAEHRDGVKKLLEQHWVGTRVQTVNNIVVLTTWWPGPEMNVQRQVIKPPKKTHRNANMRRDTIVHKIITVTGLLFWN